MGQYDEGWYICPRCRRRGMHHTIACWMECIYCEYNAHELDVVEREYNRDEGENETRQHANE